jgi:hypothetical protein
VHPSILEVISIHHVFCLLLSCSCWIRNFILKMQPHLKNVTELIPQANKDSDDEVTEFLDE